MMTHFYRLCFSVLLLCCSLFAVPCAQSQSTQPAENIALLDSLAGTFASSVHATASRVVFSDHPAASRLRRFFYTRQADSSVPALHYDITDFGVRYTTYDRDADSLVRTVSLWLTPVRTAAAPTAADYNAIVNDTIARADIPFVESRQFEFARAPVPAPPSDFYSDIAEPLIVVSAAVITILLLFTVRSQ